ncbi:ABC transporter ATP-binding protein/permease [Deltaproteobacteria bacterium]|nr:ABC transporter ATP-binding protein/permease [Deltaproteobacteria bacterium]
MSHNSSTSVVTVSPMWNLFRYLKPHWKYFSWLCFASIANKVLDLMPPVLVGWVIDSVRREPPDWISDLLGTFDPWNLAVFLAVLGVVIFFFESIFQWAYQYGFMNLAQSVQHQLRTDAYNQLQTREIEFFENHRMGETMAMLNDDVNQIERFLNIGFNEILQLLVLFIFAGSMMFGVSWELAVVGLLPLPIVLWGSLIYQNLISPRYRKVREAVGSLSSRLENNIAGILVIKSFTAENFESSRVSESSQQYQKANFQAIKLSSVYVPLIRMAIAVGFGGVLLVGSYWVLEENGMLTVGELVFFSMMIQRILWPLTRMGVTLDEYERAKASARRTFGLLQTPSKIVNPVKCKKLVLPVQGSIELRNVSFTYQRGGVVLNDLNFMVDSGEMVGIAGVTGAGKSTLIKMLLRLYDPKQGQVLLDGIDIRQLELSELRAQIALVSQEVYLFHGTIAENIAYGSEKMDFKLVEAASRSAQLHDFVQSLPESYQTIVGERGIRLSGGQRQRLSIARAVLKNSPVMIFDEATSSVDTETERAIQANLSVITKGKTALVIAHRLSTIRYADRILVLRDGKVAEEGHHNELVAKNGTYADLWHIQSGDFGSQ